MTADGSSVFARNDELREALRRAASALAANGPEFALDFGPLLPAVRAVREQVDWERVRADTADNDFAVAFLALIDRLGVTA
ncbi:hypothetical protein [Candidatus Mycobacterium methanotrophicum]|uniref:Uncharacterized protein n=1 Tax=Candidatus Mycobacterium methanotrophicum TaxID=2943498 RepID=A0ABY4QTH6_9MYCO|nr:hypothetical protein [Candidatus Mycobacterium methanotrophicum]UQX13380.1 hypothetical protein M5I08_03350 [Candidatus Mycobacterium methanotrophicum]